MNTRTIMIFPQFENINVINDIREKYDPLAHLVRPHITLVFPFNSELTNNALSSYLKDCLDNIHPFNLELRGFSREEDKFGNYLFLNVTEGMDIIKEIHDKLYSDKLKEFDLGYDYIPHMTVGKLPSKELLDQAFDNVQFCHEKFNTLVNKVSVEMIGEHEESIIVIEQSLK